MIKWRMKSGPTRDARTRLTEREGFEPSIRVSAYAGLANRCLQPLGHLSGRCRNLDVLEGGLNGMNFAFWHGHEVPRFRRLSWAALGGLADESVGLRPPRERAARGSGSPADNSSRVAGAARRTRPSRSSDGQIPGH